MFTEILVPLDGSKLSERVLPYVKSLAEGLKIPIELLAVVDPDMLIAPAVESESYQKAFFADRKKIAQHYLKNIAGILASGFHAEQFVVVGKPAETIVKHAAMNPKALVAMGTHGRSGVERWVLGSVADEVLHSTKNPVLLVRTTEEPPKNTGAFKSVIVPLDGSALAETVLPVVAELYRTMKLEVILMRIWEIPVLYYDEGYALEEHIVKAIEDESRNYVDRKVIDLKRQGVGNVKGVIVQGFPAESIIDLAAKTPNAFIAMCTHGRSGVRRWILGSVTERLVRHSGDPVLVIRPADFKPAV